MFKAEYVNTKRKHHFSKDSAKGFPINLFLKFIEVDCRSKINSQNLYEFNK